VAQLIQILTNLGLGFAFGDLDQILDALGHSIPKKAAILPLPHVELFAEGLHKNREFLPQPLRFFGGSCLLFPLSPRDLKEIVQAINKDRLQLAEPLAMLKPPHFSQVT
jgi:hypothetical protein